MKTLKKGDTVNYWPSPFAEEDEKIRDEKCNAIKAVVTHVNFLTQGDKGVIGSANVNLNLLIAGKAPIERKSVSFAKDNGCSRSFTVIQDEKKKK
jgi:hypothetical protein